MNHSRNLLLLTLVVFATSLPFIGRAFFVDDHYFFTIAKHLAADPLHPYDFRADDERPQTLGWERGQPPRMVNPLLFHYYLAAVMRIWGDAVWKLRASTLVFSLLAVYSMYFLGTRFSARPLYAALLLAVTPAYWLTSYSLLIDGAMIGFFLAALWTFIAGLERRHAGLMVLSGLLMGATLLTKYTGGLVLVLAALWQAQRPADRRWLPGYIAYGMALALLGLWSVWTFHLYGATHVLASAARGLKSGEPVLFYLYKGLVLASFLGGGTLFLLGAPFLLWRRSRTVAGMMLLFFLGLIGVLTSAKGGFALSLSVQLAFWISLTASFFGALVLTRRPRAGTERFLYIWLAAGVLELIVVMPWTAGRYLLILLPPVIWLFDEALAEFSWTHVRAAVLILTAFGGLLLARADQAQANVVVDLSRQLAGKDCSKGGCYYLGDTFSAYPAYLGSLGWQAAFPDQIYRPGDVLVIAHYRQSSWWTLPHSLKRRSLGGLVYPSRLPVRLMDVPASAGWYASAWGALPFAITGHPLEEYAIYEIL